MHPITSDKIRTFLARTNLLYIIFGYIFVTLIVALILAFLYKIGDSNGINYLKWWQFSITQLLSVEPPNDISYELSGFQNIIFVLASILGVVLPALFFGAIVFKLFIHKNMLVFRKNMLIYRGRYEQKLLLAATIYNSSKLRVVNGYVRVYVRGRTYDKHEKLNITNKLIAEFYPPSLKWHRTYHILIDLEETDVIFNNEAGYNLISIKGMPIQETTEIMFIISGSIPELGTDMVEDFTYRLSNSVQWGYRENIPDDELNPSKSESWKRFEEVIEPLETPSENLDI